MIPRVCEHCDLELPRDARANRRFCNGACRTANHREKASAVASGSRPKPPPSAWIVLALDLHRAAPDEARGYRLQPTGKGWPQTVPGVGFWWLDPFQPPEIPREGRYQVQWVDENGHEVDGPAVSFWLGG